MCIYLTWAYQMLAEEIAISISFVHQQAIKPYNGSAIANRYAIEKGKLILGRYKKIIDSGYSCFIKLISFVYSFQVSTHIVNACVCVCACGSVFVSTIFATSQKCFAK